jgi:hypothetical protein
MDKAHRTAFNDMLEQAQTHSLATFEAKYQKGLERFWKAETITYQKSLSSTTDEYRKRLDATFNKHRIAINQKSNDMETLANDLVENAPFEAGKEISYVVNDAIREVTESITNIKEQSIAEWTSNTIPAKSLSPQIKQAVDYAMTQRQHKVVRLDEHILLRQTTIKELETTITQQQQGLTTFLQNSQHTFETTIQDIIERETGNNEGSTLNDLLTRENNISSRANGENPRGSQDHNRHPFSCQRKGSDRAHARIRINTTEHTARRPYSSTQQCTCPTRI